MTKSLPITTIFRNSFRYMSSHWPMLSLFTILSFAGIYFLGSFNIRDNLQGGIIYLPVLFLLRTCVFQPQTTAKKA